MIEHFLLSVVIGIIALVALFCAGTLLLWAIKAGVESLWVVGTTLVTIGLSYGLGTLLIGVFT